MVKLVDTHASGACWSNPVRVRVSLSPLRLVPSTRDSLSVNTLILKNMQIEIKNITVNPVMLLRGAGYTFQRNEGQEMSFVRALARAGYPRFHMYVSVTGADMKINIHLDQKKETYGAGTRHHGEYEDEGALKTEVERLMSILS